MARSPYVARLGSEFDDFLFAPIGAGKNGMAVSVLSALARQGVDAWQEAAELARLPRGVATQRLASWVAALPDGLSGNREAGSIAARLVALLPRGPGPLVPAVVATAVAKPVFNQRSVTAFVVFVAFMIGVQCILAMS